MGGRGNAIAHCLALTEGWSARRGARGTDPSACTRCPGASETIFLKKKKAKRFAEGLL